MSGFASVQNFHSIDIHESKRSEGEGLSNRYELEQRPGYRLITIGSREPVSERDRLEPVIGHILSFLDFPSYINLKKCSSFWKTRLYGLISENQVILLQKWFPTLKEFYREKLSIRQEIDLNRFPCIKNLTGLNKTKRFFEKNIDAIRVARLTCVFERNPNFIVTAILEPYQINPDSCFSDRLFPRSDIVHQRSCCLLDKFPGDSIEEREWINRVGKPSKKAIDEEVNCSKASLTILRPQGSFLYTIEAYSTEVPLEGGSNEDIRHTMIMLMANVMKNQEIIGQTWKWNLSFKERQNRGSRNNIIIVAVGVLILLGFILMAANK